MKPRSLSLSMARLLLAALLLGACSTHETAQRLDESHYLITAATTRPDRDGMFLEAFQRRALYQAAKTTTALGRDLFRVTGKQRRNATNPGGMVVPVGTAFVIVPLPNQQPLPPGEDTASFHLWIELLDSTEPPGPDDLPVYSASDLLAAWPDIKSYVEGLARVPESNDFADVGPTDDDRGLGK